MRICSAPGHTTTAKRARRGFAGSICTNAPQRQPLKLGNGAGIHFPLTQTHIADALGFVAGAHQQNDAAFGETGIARDS